MTSIADAPPITLIPDISMQECAEKLIGFHKTICSNLERLTNTTEVVAFRILDDYLVEVDLPGRHKSLSTSFTEKTDQKTLDLYKQFVYTFITKAEVYANHFFPSLSMSTEESEANTKAQESLSTDFIQNYYLTCSKKVGELALKRLNDSDLSKESFNAYALQNNSIRVWSCRNYGAYLLPCVSTVEPTQIKDEDLELLNAYRLNQRVAMAFSYPAKSRPHYLLEESNKKIMALINARSSYQNPGYRLLPENKIEVYNSQNEEEKGVIQITDKEELQLLEDHRLYILILALIDYDYQIETISKELADYWLQQSKPETSAIAETLAQAKGISPDQITGFYSSPGRILNIHYSMHGKECSTEVNLTEEESAVFNSFLAYQRIALKKQSSPDALDHLYAWGRYLGIV